MVDRAKESPRHDIFLGAVAGTIGIALLVPSYFEGARVFLLPGDISPYFVPKVFIYCWIALSAGILLKGVVGLRRWSGDGQPYKWGAIFAVFAVTLVATALMKPLGYLLVGPAAFFASVWLIGYRQHLANLIVSLLVPIALYLLLAKLAGLSLPSTPWQG